MVKDLMFRVSGRNTGALDFPAPHSGNGGGNLPSGCSYLLKFTGKDQHLNTHNDAFILLQLATSSILMLFGFVTTLQAHRCSMHRVFEVTQEIFLVGIDIYQYLQTEKKLAHLKKFQNFTKTKIFKLKFKKHNEYVICERLIFQTSS